VSRPRVLFYVQHLLGIGHAKRAATLARAAADAGLDATLVSGGYSVPDLDIGGASLVQLAPARTKNESFVSLVDTTGAPVDDAWKEARRDALLEVWRGIRPHVLVTELFPFGRRQFRFELIPLLDEAIADSARPVIVSSVRDILVGPRPAERYDEMLGLVRRYFDHILVHGDPRLIPFAESFPHAALIEDKLHYTGYVLEPAAVADPRASNGHGDVIVSAGGGAVGEKLLMAALGARAMTGLERAVWRVLVGVSVPDAQFRILQDRAPEGVVVERARRDFRGMLANCDLSISQAGYNTIMEILQAGARGVVVPFARGIENEQMVRAERLAARGGLQIVAETDLGPAAIAKAVDEAMAGPPTSLASIDASGTATSARLIATWAKHKAETPTSTG
jgi:predicted glycosyltransferase